MLTKISYQDGHCESIAQDIFTESGSQYIAYNSESLHVEGFSGIGKNPGTLFIVEITDIAFLNKSTKCDPSCKGEHFLAEVLKTRLRDTQFYNIPINIKIPDGSTTLADSTINIIHNLLTKEQIAKITVNDQPFPARKEPSQTNTSSTTNTSNHEANSIQNQISESGYMLLGAGLISALDLSYTYYTESSLQVQNPMTIVKCALVLGAAIYIYISTTFKFITGTFATQVNNNRVKN